MWLGWLVAISILVVVAIGWRPRVTGILHWWVAHSFATSCLVVEGGDQAAALIALLLVPITMTDRRLALAASAPARAAVRDTVASLVAGSAFNVIRLQVAVIYFVASTSKLSVPEWSNGTALYYWLLGTRCSGCRSTSSH